MWRTFARQDSLLAIDALPTIVGALVLPDLPPYSPALNTKETLWELKQAVATTERNPELVKPIASPLR